MQYTQTILSPPSPSAVRLLFLVLLLAACTSLPPGGLPYDPKADAPAVVEAGWARAQASGHPLLLLFGANWCEDCRHLDHDLHEPANAALMAAEYEVVKVDVGNFDRNMAVVMDWGNPVAGGIPAAVLVGANRKVLYATRAGELADARRMDAAGVGRFFSELAERARSGRLRPDPP